MKILVVSQRAIGTNTFQLNNLTANGRLDVIMRCILAAQRRLSVVETHTNTIYCFLKGGDREGWIEWNSIVDTDDEISIASKIKECWNEVFYIGNIGKLMDKIDHKTTILLSETGNNYEQLVPMGANPLFVLGAQNDLTSEDLEIISPDHQLSLSDQPMLASHAIIKLRQILTIKNPE